MGRSVSTPSGAALVAYRNVSDHGHDNFCHTCDEEGNEEWECPECKADLRDFEHYCEFRAQDDWEDFKSWLMDTAQEQWPSLEECDKWIGREDLALLCNSHVYFGISEYCGLVAIWMVDRRDTDGYQTYEEGERNLARRWVDQVADKFDALFGEYNRLGTMSNGEGVFQVKEKAA